MSRNQNRPRPSRMPCQAALAAVATACALAGPAQAGTVTNGSFENAALDGSAAGWSDTDSVFGFTRCDVFTCGVGGSPATTGAHDGSYWALFGGDAAAQTAELTQSVTLDAALSTLQFMFWAGQSGADARLDLSVDGMVVWSVDAGTATAYAAGYFLQSVSLAAFADGGVHTLGWRYSDVGTSSNAASWNLDAVSLVAAPLSAPGSLALAGIALMAAVAGRRRALAAQRRG